MQIIAALNLISSVFCKVVLLLPSIPTETENNSPLGTVMPETAELFAQRCLLVASSVGTSLRLQQRAVGTADMMVSGLAKGEMIFQQLQDQCLQGKKLPLWSAKRAFSIRRPLLLSKGMLTRKS